MRKRITKLPTSATTTVMVNGVATEIRSDQKVVTNMMSQKQIVLSEDTPLCCDPSTETYWSM